MFSLKHFALRLEYKITAHITIKWPKIIRKLSLKVVAYTNKIIVIIK